MRRRTAWLSRHPTRWGLLVPVVMAAAGILFATSFQTAQGTDIRSSGQGLVEVVRDGNRAVEAKTARVLALQEQVDQLAAEAAASGGGAILDLRRETAALAPAAGTAAVAGPAVSVALDDAHRSVASLPKPYGPDDIVVHQQDVQAVVNALWAGGAEAMTIMDQRVVTTSAVRCVGSTLILDGRVYSPPFVVSAIGPVEGLQGALEDDPQVAIYREWVDAVGLGYEVTTQDWVEFPAYQGLATPGVAQVR